MDEEGEAVDAFLFAFGKEGVAWGTGDSAVAEPDREPEAFAGDAPGCLMADFLFGTGSQEEG